MVDFPTAFYGYADTVVGQFPNLGGEQEPVRRWPSRRGTRSSLAWTMAIERDARADGTLDDLKAEWLETDTDVPTFS